MPERQRLVSGFWNRVRDRSYIADRMKRQRMAQDKPGILFISGFGPGISPCDLFGPQAGEVLSHNEIAAIIPPYDSARSLGPYALLAKLEYAITVRAVKHIVVLGQAGCPGIETLVEGTDHAALAAWVEVAYLAMERARQICGTTDKAALRRETERQVVIQSLRNLMTYPVVYNAVKHGAVSLNGWLYDAEQDSLYEYDPDLHGFRTVGEGDASGSAALPGENQSTGV